MPRTILIALLAALPLTFAQAPAKRFVYVNVTDAMGRQVNGLHLADFELLEDGQRRPLGSVLDPASPISIAVVSEQSLTASNDLDLGPQDELIQTRSAAAIAGNLLVSGNPRKAIIIPANTPREEIPPGIQVVTMDVAGLGKTVAMLRNQYTLEFTTSTPQAPVQIALQAPRGLPRFTLTWK